MDRNTGYNVISCLCLGNGFVPREAVGSKILEQKDAYTLHYVTEGKGRVTIDGISFFVSKGQSFLTFPFSNVEKTPDSGNPWSYKWVEFRGLEAAWLISQTSFSKKRPVVDKILIPEFERMFDISESGQTSTYAQCRASGRLILLLSYYLEHFPCKSEENKNYAILAQRYIEKNYKNPEFNVKSVAEFVKIDRTYLYRLFKAETGMSIIDYINNHRIAKAEVMLMDKHISIKDVAYSVGFTDQMYFSKVFKKLKNITPTEFRKQHADNYY